MSLNLSPAENDKLQLTIHGWQAQNDEDQTSSNNMK
jgi:hypothetical protein